MFMVEIGQHCGPLKNRTPQYFTIVSQLWAVAQGEGRVPEAEGYCGMFSGEEAEWRWSSS